MRKCCLLGAYARFLLLRIAPNVGKLYGVCFSACVTDICVFSLLAQSAYCVNNV